MLQECSIDVGSGTLSHHSCQAAATASCPENLSLLVPALSWMITNVGERCDRAREIGDPIVVAEGAQYR